MTTNSVKIGKDTRAYSTIQLWMLVLLRIAIGWHFLYEGFAKIYTPGWTSADYLEVSRWIFAGFFKWIASNPAALQIVDFLNIWGLILIGFALIMGCFVRLASISGMVLLLLYYLANPPFVGLDFGVPTEGSYLVVNKNFVEFLALGVLFLFPTGTFLGVDRMLKNLKQKKALSSAVKSEKPDPDAQTVPPNNIYRRELLKSFATLPFLGAFGYALAKQKKWKSWEEKNLVDAMTSASVKVLDITCLSELKGTLPRGTIKNAEFSRIILGGNLLSGYSHSRDLIYVSDLVKAYHHKDKIFATLLLAEKCGVNTLLTNPILCTIINEYWKRDIGKIQFISDCAGLDYDETGTPDATPFDQYMDRIKRAIDYGAIACYIQGETADYYMSRGQADVIAKALQLIRDRGVITGIGAHHIETIKACVDAGFEPDFWMKTLHHHDYWSARHPTWHDNMYCFNPEETIQYMNSLKQPMIAFKVMAAGSIPPESGFRFAFENGVDFICAGMYDFQMVKDVNIALDILNGDSMRNKQWRA
ncbi:DoxX family protein [candidate division KSB1 bacterium]|nr:DoxX family protein [candidate division KSB1 bacterium]